MSRDYMVTVSGLTLPGVEGGRVLGGSLDRIQVVARLWQAVAPDDVRANQQL